MRYVSHLACTVCGTTFSAETPMNLCAHDGRPIQVLMDLDRLKIECGRDGWWNPARRDLWRFGGLLPLDNPGPVARALIRLVARGRGHAGRHTGAGGPRVHSLRQSRRARQHGLGREVPAGFFAPPSMTAFDASDDVFRFVLVHARRAISR